MTKVFIKFFSKANFLRLIDAIYSRKQKIDSSVDKIGNIKSQNFLKGQKELKFFIHLGIKKDICTVDL